MLNTDELYFCFLYLATTKSIITWNNSFRIEAKLLPPFKVFIVCPQNLIYFHIFDTWDIPSNVIEERHYLNTAMFITKIYLREIEINILLLNLANYDHRGFVWQLVKKSIHSCWTDCEEIWSRYSRGIPVVVWYMDWTNCTTAKKYGTRWFGWITWIDWIAWLIWIAWWTPLK